MITIINNRPEVKKKKNINNKKQIMEIIFLLIYKVIGRVGLIISSISVKIILKNKKQ